MSARANPRAIGMFVLGALAIAILAIAVMASGTWFRRRPTFISYFPESVNGLQNGAPVKFQGVPVGRVVGVDIQINPSDDSFLVPVKYEVDLSKLTTPSGAYVNLADASSLERQIGKGLRAQLQMESFVTGVLYVQLSYRSDSTAPRRHENPTRLLEIPSTPSLMTAIGGGAGSMLDEVSKILTRVNNMLGEVNIRDINRSVLQSSKAIEALLNAPELRATLREMPGTTAQLNRTLAEAQKLASRVTVAMDTLQTGATGLTTDARATLDALRHTLDETNALLSADTGPGYALTDALVSMKEASEALRALIRSLEQNPDMLLRGRKAPEKK